MKNLNKNLQWFYLLFGLLFIAVAVNLYNKYVKNKEGFTSDSDLSENKKKKTNDNNEMFSKIIYINLDHRKDRNQNVLKELDNANITWDKYDLERLSAINGKDLTNNNIPDNLITQSGKDVAFNKKLNYPYMSKGAIGCALSHYNIYISILNSSNERTLILEDDIIVDKDFIKKLESYKDDIPDDFDILWIGYHDSEDLNVMEKINDVCFVPSYIFGTFAYIINKKAAEKLLELYPITVQVDSEIPKKFLELKVYALAADKKLILSEPSNPNSEYGTDIQNM